MVQADDMGRRRLLRFLVDVLCHVPTLLRRDGRDLVIQMMDMKLDEPLFVEDHPKPVGHLFNLAKACHRTPERLSALVRVVSLIEQDSGSVRGLPRVVGELTLADPFLVDDRARLLTLMVGLSAPGLYGLLSLTEVFWFLEHVATRVRTELSIELQRWTYDQTDWMGLAEELVEAREKLRAEVMPLTPPGSPAWLVLRLCADGPSGDRHRLSSWRQLGNPRQWAPLPGGDFTGSLDQVKRHVVEQVEDDWGRYQPDIHVEFVLDYDNLNEPVDQWPWDDPHLVQPLGCKYPVVVRSLERMTTRRYHREWWQRWDELERQLERAKRVTRTSTCQGTAELRELLSLFNRERGLVSLVLSAPPCPDAVGRDEVAVGVKAGVPLILWHCGDCASAEFEELVESVLHGQNDHHLLERVRLARTRAFAEGPARRHVGEALTVLYDDPTRLVAPTQPGPPPEGAAV